MDYTQDTVLHFHNSFTIWPNRTQLGSYPSSAFSLSRYETSRSLRKTPLYAHERKRQTASCLFPGAAETSLCSFLAAAGKESHKVGGLKQRIFRCSSGGQRSKIKVSDLALSGDGGRICSMPLSYHLRAASRSWCSLAYC